MTGLSRSTDPPTSHLAAALADATGRNKLALEIMRDGEARIAEELWWAMRRMGRKYSDTSARQGMNWLKQYGLIEYTGRKRKTSDGGDSMEWRWKEEGQATLF